MTAIGPALRPALGAVLLLVAAAPASAQSPPEALTWMVLNEINSAWFDRTEPFNRPPLVTRVPEGVIRPVDVSHDGRSDWLIDYTDSGLMYCGTGGCLRTLYVSNGDDYLMAFDEQTHTLDISARDGETVIDAKVHHVFCGPAGDDCAFAWTWDASLQQLVERPNAAGGTLLPNDGGFPPVAWREGSRPVADLLPEELAAVWRTSRVTCATEQEEDGLRIYRATFKSVPDLNGDGRARLAGPQTGPLRRVARGRRPARRLQRLADRAGRRTQRSLGLRAGSLGRDRHRHDACAAYQQPGLRL